MWDITKRKSEMKGISLINAKFWILGLRTNNHNLKNSHHENGNHFLFNVSYFLHELGSEVNIRCLNIGKI